MVGYDMTGESGFSCKVILNTDRQPIGGSVGVGSGIGTIHNILRQHLDFFWPTHPFLKCQISINTVMNVHTTGNFLDSPTQSFADVIYEWSQLGVNLTTDMEFSFDRVRILWEGHKILRNLHLTFVHSTYIQTKGRWRFLKILWPSQNIWTLSVTPRN